MTSNMDKSNQITEGLRKSFQKGDCKIPNRTCFGYDPTSCGELIINEVEAKVIRWIF